MKSIKELSEELLNYFCEDYISFSNLTDILVDVSKVYNNKADIFRIENYDIIPFIELLEEIGITSKENRNPIYNLEKREDDYFNGETFSKWYSTFDTYSINNLNDFYNDYDTYISDFTKETSFGCPFRLIKVI